MPPRRRRLIGAALGALIALGAVAAAQLAPRAAPARSATASVSSAARPRPAPQPSAAPPAAPQAAAPAAQPQAAPAVAPPPPPTPVIETWIAHRDLAATYTERGQREDAFREVEAAIGESPAAASADPALLQAAVNALAAERVAFVTSSFRSNPRLVDALAEATGQGATAELRHAAHAALRQIDQETRADLVGMQIRDLEQATRCADMRATWKRVRTSDDPRVDGFRADLRKRGRNDPHVRCLRRAMRR